MPTTQPSKKKSTYSPALRWWSWGVATVGFIVACDYAVDFGIGLADAGGVHCVYNLTIPPCKVVKLLEAKEIGLRVLGYLWPALLTQALLPRKQRPFGMTLGGLAAIVICLLWGIETGPL
jgi:hypothetical protein